MMKQKRIGKVILFSLLILLVLTMSVFANTVTRGSDSNKIFAGESVIACESDTECKSTDKVFVNVIAKYLKGFSEGEKSICVPVEENICSWTYYYEVYPEDLDSEELTCDNFEAIVDSTGLIVSTEKACLVGGAVNSLEKASEEYFGESGESIKVTSAFRSIEDQAELFWDNCYSGEVYRGCSPPTSSLKILGGEKNSELVSASTEEEVVSTFLKYGDPYDGYHTKGTAVDVWHEKANNFVANVQKTKELQDVMESNGFCRETSEIWHYDYTGSNGCSTGQGQKGYTYTVGGTKYDPEEMCRGCGVDVGDCSFDYKEGNVIKDGGELCSSDVVLGESDVSRYDSTESDEENGVSESDLGSFSFDSLEEGDMLLTSSGECYVFESKEEDNSGVYFNFGLGGGDIVSLNEYSGEEDYLMVVGSRYFSSITEKNHDFSDGRYELSTGSCNSGGISYSCNTKKLCLTKNE